MSQSDIAAFFVILSVAKNLLLSDCQPPPEKQKKRNLQNLNNRFAKQIPDFSEAITERWYYIGVNGKSQKKHKGELYK